jgi:hypothetical protein
VVRLGQTRGLLAERINKLVLDHKVEEGLKRSDHRRLKVAEAAEMAGRAIAGGGETGGAGTGGVAFAAPAGGGGDDARGADGRPLPIDRTARLASALAKVICCRAAPSDRSGACSGGVGVCVCVARVRVCAPRKIDRESIAALRRGVCVCVPKSGGSVCCVARTACFAAPPCLTGPSPPSMISYDTI